MGNPRAARTRVFVTPFTGSVVNYGFPTNADAATKAALGHETVTNTTPNLVFGANTPKPGRASKGGNNSFYDIGKIASLKTAKWVLTPPKRRPQKSSAKSKAVFITLEGGVKYAWKMPAATYAAIGADRAGLGIQDCVTSEKDYVTGTSQPRPTRVRKVITTGTGAGATDETYSTFIDFDKIATIPAGWSIISSGSEVLF